MTQVPSIVSGSLCICLGQRPRCLRPRTGFAASEWALRRAALRGQAGQSPPGADLLAEAAGQFRPLRYPQGRPRLPEASWAQYQAQSC